MVVRNSGQRWLPLFLLAHLLPIGAATLANPLNGKYEALLRNDTSQKVESAESIGGVHSVDASGSVTLSDERSDDVLSAQYAVNGTYHDFDLHMSVDAGHPAQDSTARSTLELSAQDYVSILDENGDPLNLRRLPPRAAIVFHVSFSGSLHFQPSDSLPTDPTARSLVVGEARLSFWPLVSDATERQEIVISARDALDGLQPDREHTLDLGQLLSPATLSYHLGSSRLNYQWKFGARTLATSGAISIDAPEFFRIDAITFQDGTTPESHGFSLQFHSGLVSPNLRVPEPASAIFLISGLLLAYGIHRRRAYARVTHP